MGFLNSLFKRKKKRNEGQVFVAEKLIGGANYVDLMGYKNGTQSTVVLGIKCGGCGQEFKDALVPNKETSIICPFCHGTNKATYNLPSPSDITFVVLGDDEK